MSSLRDRQHAKKRKNTLFLFFGVVIFFVLLFTTPLSSFFTKTTQVIGLPVWHARLVLADEIPIVRDVIIKTKTTLIHERDALQEKLIAVQGALLDMKRLQEENQELRRQLNVIDQEQSFVTVRVLAHAHDSAYNGIIIDAGADDGIVAGDHITVFGTVLLGTVVEVFPQTARVELYTDPMVQHDVRLPVQEISLQSTGRGSGSIQFEIPREIAVAEGDYILDHNTSFIIGVIHTSLSDPREPLQTVLGRVPVNVEHLQWVQVISTP